MIILLSAMLIAGAVFLFMPLRFFAPEKEKTLATNRYDTAQIGGIVMFVSSRRKEEKLEDLLAYKILTQMAEGISKKVKRAWLIHGGTLDEEGSSYRNTVELISAFKTSGIRIKPVGIDDIFDANESFQLIDDIFRRQLYGMNPRDVVCDFTSGTKLMTLGMALACAGDKKLIYFPKTNESDGRQYLHVDTQSLLTGSNV